MTVLMIGITLVIAASLAYCGLCIMAGIGFSRGLRTNAFAKTLPPVSVLKPLKGADPGLYQSLRSHCVQDYAEYEIVFGAGSRSDPAVAEVEKLQREFPERQIQLVICEQRLGANGKISSLAQMLRSARHEFLVISDSDIRVGPDYLATIICELQQPAVGLVTCLYRGVPANSMPSRIEAIGISSDFLPGVLAARIVERGLKFGLGATLALRRDDLKSIGGFESLGDYLADDYELGRRIAAQEQKVVLSRAVLETFLPAYDWPQFFAHQLRWARTIRAARPAGYAGLLITFTVPWALVAVALSRGAGWAWLLLGSALLLRIVMGAVFGTLVLQGKSVLGSLWLIPVRDLLGVVIWVGGWFGNRIVWRGEHFRLRKGKLERIA